MSLNKSEKDREALSVRQVIEQNKIDKNIVENTEETLQKNTGDNENGKVNISESNKRIKEVNNKEKLDKTELKEESISVEQSLKESHLVGVKEIYLPSEERVRLSKGKPKNLDSELKFMTKLLYSKKGYYCEYECRLFEDSYYGKYRREEISDIDVLGIKYESDLKSFKVGIECKSTRNNGVDELLKARGIQELLDLQYVGLAKNYVHSNVRLIAKKLGVQLHSYKELVSLVESMYPNANELFSKEEHLFLIKENIERELKADIKGIVNFTKAGFWTNEQYQNINTIVRALEHISEKNLKGYQLTYITIRLATLLSISLLDVASIIIRSDYFNLEHVALDMLFGGATARREKERAYDIISQEVGKKIDPHPPYKNDYLSMVNWIVKAPNHTRYLPRCLDYYLECYLLGMDYNLIKKSFDVTTIKVCKDILRFTNKIMRNTNLHQNFLDL
ncbi:hypothetical protein OWP15_11615 [Bacillus paranthracis]|uniref:hypothetical protein n=1 Tax=Bacillus paranthracis TaxID=2026186 RepID=UPI000789D3E0|nr:hypothetical protein [Bacillus paranthracis]KYQ01873.1 hypothetical protein B4079_3155 [Bacillus cereus]MDK7473362.1 hypothetical protein [Bacillus paranthracis]